MLTKSFLSVRTSAHRSPCSQLNFARRKMYIGRAFESSLNVRQRQAKTEGRKSTGKQCLVGVSRGRRKGCESSHLLPEREQSATGLRHGRSLRPNGGSRRTNETQGCDGRRDRWIRVGLCSLRDFTA